MARLPSKHLRVEDDHELLVRVADDALRDPLVQHVQVRHAGFAQQIFVQLARHLVPAGRSGYHDVDGQRIVSDLDSEKSRAAGRAYPLSACMRFHNTVRRAPPRSFSGPPGAAAGAGAGRPNRSDMIRIGSVMRPSAGAGGLISTDSSRTSCCSLRGESVPAGRGGTWAKAERSAHPRPGAPTHVVRLHGHHARLHVEPEPLEREGALVELRLQLRY